MEMRQLLVAVIFSLCCLHETFGKPCDSGYVDSGGICDECGISMNPPNTHVIGKLEALNHSWPSHAFITLKLQTKAKTERDEYEVSISKYICSGTIINRQTVLTAASCVDFKIVNMTHKINVYLGLNNIQFLHDQTKIRKNAIKADVQKIKIHETYSAYRYDHDIALLILSEPVEFNDYIRPACLPNWESEYPYERNDITALEVDTGDNHLKNFHWKVGECFNENPEIYFCANDLPVNMYKENCNDDIGGGIYTPQKTPIGGKQRFRLSGLKTSSFSCGRSYRSYIRTARYLRWIRYNWKLLNNATKTEEQKKSGVNTKTIVGTVIGVVLLLAFVVVGVIVLFVVKRKRTKNKSNTKETERTTQNINNNTAEEILKNDKITESEGLTTSNKLDDITG